MEEVAWQTESIVGDNHQKRQIRDGPSCGPERQAGSLSYIAQCVVTVGVRVRGLGGKNALFYSSHEGLESNVR